jgi:hypothetical protein
MKKKIEFLCDIERKFFTFKKGEKYNVSIIRTDLLKNCCRYLALVEFGGGSITSFQIDHEIAIIGDPK